jgi:hypothetical protein
MLVVDANLAEIDLQVGSARPSRCCVKSFESLFDSIAKRVGLRTSRLEVPGVSRLSLAQGPAEVFEACGEIDRRGGCSHR